MSKEIHTQKHLTLSDRIFIEQSLANHTSFKDIAAVLKKDPSTISKEIRKQRMFKEGSHYNLKNNCALLSSSNVPGYAMANFAIICANAVKPVTAQSIVPILFHSSVKSLPDRPMSAMDALIMPADTTSTSIGLKMRILPISR